MVVQNVGHVPNYYTGARNYVLSADSGPPPRISDADITIHPESKSGDSAKLAQLSALGLKFAATSEVAIVCHNMACTVEVLFSAHAGLLIVRVTKDGARPLIVMAVYLRPGLKSRDSAIVTCNLIRSWHRLLSRSYPGELIIIGGDFNSSVVTSSRHTADTQHRGHYKVVHSLLYDLQYSPLHGRSAASLAQFTSRSTVEARDDVLLVRGALRSTLSLHQLVWTPVASASATTSHLMTLQAREPLLMLPSE